MVNCWLLPSMVALKELTYHSSPHTSVSSNSVGTRASNARVTFLGTLAGIAGAAAVSLVSFAVGMLPWSWLAPAILAAVVGMLADSYLGATLERRKLLNNDAVNFLSTLVAAAITLLW